VFRRTIRIQQPFRVNYGRSEYSPSTGSITDRSVTNLAILLRKHAPPLSRAWHCLLGAKARALVVILRSLSFQVPLPIPLCIAQIDNFQVLCRGVLVCMGPYDFTNLSALDGLVSLTSHGCRICLRSIVGLFQSSRDSIEQGGYSGLISRFPGSDGEGRRNAMVAVERPGSFGQQQDHSCCWEMENRRGTPVYGSGCKSAHCGRG
jgi:hypothetical protein